MKHLIYFEDYLAESVLNIDTIYNKYYTNIERDIFDKIIKADPTTALKDSKMGVYCKWLLKLYSDKNLKLEDLYKATNYISAFHQFKHKIHQKDINFYKSLPELFKAVEPFLEKEETKFENDEERKLAGQFKEAYRNKDLRIITPLTLKASQYFGRDTEWCTTNTDMFKKYTKKQTTDITPYNLYIMYPTENSLFGIDDRLQFHFQSRQFMGIYDEPFPIEEFFREYPDMFDFFNKYFDVEKYFKSGHITWYGNTLEGAPETVDGDFICHRYSDISSLISGPKIVEGDFICTYNNLTNLIGAPETVDGSFYCWHNRLISLKGSPDTVGGSFICSDNMLNSLKYSPYTVEGKFNCSKNKLTSLEGAPRKVGGNFECNNNQLTTLQGAPETVDYDFICEKNPDLSEEEIIRYYNTGAVKGTIYSDYGEFEPKIKA